MEHPQKNAQAEAANQVLVRGLKRRLEKAKENWVEELSHVLWTYCATPQSIIGQTHLRLSSMYKWSF